MIKWTKFSDPHGMRAQDSGPQPVSFVAPPRVIWPEIAYEFPDDPQIHDRDGNEGTT